MAGFLDHCTDQPVRELTAGEVLIVEREPVNDLFVVVEGAYEVARSGVVIGTVDEPGSMIGEVSFLLDSAASATVTATGGGRVHVIDDPAGFVAAHPAASQAIARLLAQRLDRLTAFLTDVIAQYEGVDGNLGLLGDVLGSLAFSSGDTVEPGSERDPDPTY